MNVKENILEFSKDILRVNKLVDINSDLPYTYIEVECKRYFDNLKPNVKPFPYKIKVWGDDDLDRDLKQQFSLTPRNLPGGIQQYRNGYILVAYNATTHNYKITRRMEYLGTLTNTNFYDPNYLDKNIFDNLRSDMIELAKPDEYDFILMFFIGDQLDYFNGFKYVYNASNPSEKRVVQLDGTNGLYPIDFMNRIGTQLPIDEIERDSYTNHIDGKPTSRPFDYFIPYIGKYNIHRDLMTEEYYSYETPGRDKGGTLRMLMTLTNESDVMDDFYNKINPFKNTYIKDGIDSTLEEENDGIILYGFRKETPFNIYDCEYIEDHEVIIDYKGKEYVKSSIIDLYPVDDESTPHFKVKPNLGFGEIKKEDQ